MKKEVIVLLLLGTLLVSPLVLAQEQFNKEHTNPTAENIACMQECSGCNYGSPECTQKEYDRCGVECGVDVSGPPTPAGEGEACMQKCILVGCGEFEFDCQNSKMGSCEDECGMKGDAPDESEMDEEQICISECVSKVDPSIICQSGTFEGEGETGNEICRKCAKSCEHLYSGPCLGDGEWTKKEKVCIAQCEHCYGAPIRGPSGQGWDCTISIKCEDASAEWGDEPGTGPDSWEEGHAPSENDIYWGDYESDLEVSGSEGILEIRNTNIKNVGRKVKINIKSEEGVSLEKKDEKLIVKNEEIEIEIDNNLDKLVISDKGNKREIKDINIGIEGGKPIYKYEEKEKVKFLGIIPVNKNVRKIVDAEKMEMLEEKGPWWDFLASESIEE